MLKKILSIGLAMCLSVALITGCKNANQADSIANQNTSVVAEEGDTRTIVDQMGNTVVLPKEVNRVVIASVWPLASVYCLSMGSTDKLVGLDPAIISAAKNSMLMKVAPDIVDIDSSFSNNGSLSVEELIKLKPDVVLYASGVPEDYEVAKKAGIPAVGFSLSIKDYNAIETINSWMELLGEVMGKDMVNEEYIKYGTDMQNMVAERLKDVKEEDKPRDMFIHKYSESTLTIPGDKSWAEYWISASGGRNVAKDAVEGTLETDMEQIYKWNPDKIFITNFNDAMPEDLYNNTLSNYDWSNVSAVQNKEVRKMPLGMYRWYVCCSDSPLVLLWMAKQNQPQLFADIDMDKEMKEFYKKFYNIDLSDSDLEKIYNSSREAAGGIK
ncbi:ABC transporter substrate-binding protein [uncultured Clostridium sp.]|uniref:ABC transporter substrate-binding protein n=1 Tax=uncultured Clostridium sp. TaxID=59620 RepID=UPI0025F1FA0D|nr:ABC transporter substrate-binding protein [uncultured Clostridium sp.]